MTHLFAIGLAAALGLTATPSRADDILVAFQHTPTERWPEAYQRKPEWNLNNFGIRLRGYTVATYPDGLLADLERAPMLVFTSNEETPILFRDPAVIPAIRAFLERGGVLVFDSQGMPDPNPRFPENRAFYEGIGVEPPGWARLTRALKLADGAGSDPLLTTPNPVTRIGSAYDLFGPLQEGQTALMVSQDNPGLAGLAIQRGVCGRGTIVYCGLAGMEKRPDLLPNLLRLAYATLSPGLQVPAAAAPEAGSPTGPERAAAIDGPAVEPCASKLPVTRLNPLYLRGLVKKSWWHPAWTERIPVVAHNPLPRMGPRIVAMHFTLPDWAALSSIRVVTPGRRELPSQARFLEGSARQVEVLVQPLFYGYQNLVWFVYYGPAEMPPPAYETELEVRERGGRLVLLNERFRAEFRLDWGILDMLAPRGAVYGNQFSDYFDHGPVGFGVRSPLTLAHRLVGWRLLADGPIRKQVRLELEHAGAPYTADYLLDARSPGLGYVVRGAGFSQDSRWAAGAGFEGDRDLIFLAAPDGVKMLPVEVDLNAPFARADLAEGWYAFQDTQTGMTCGELMDLDPVKRWVFEYRSESQMVFSLHPDGPGERRGAFLALPEGRSWRDVRDAYLAFKHPVAVALGEPQARDRVPAEPARPVFGRTQIRSEHIKFKAAKTPYGWAFYDPIPFLDAMLPVFADQGFNGFYSAIYSAHWHPTRFPAPFFTARPDAPRNFLREILDTVRRHGLFCTVTIENCSQPSFYPEPIRGTLTDRNGLVDHADPRVIELEAEAVREIAAHRPDALMLSDEECYQIGRGGRVTEPARAAFRARYGMDPVERVEEPKLKDPRHHRTALYQMDVWTERLRALSAAARAEHPDLVVFDQVNASSMTRVYAGAPHDWERQADALTAICMDLYGRPDATFKYYGKLKHGMFRNRRPHITICGLGEAGDQVPNAVSAMMWGAGYLCFYTRSFDSLGYNAEHVRLCQFLDFTEAGDLSLMPPWKRVAVLWDRDAMIHGLTNAEWTAGGSLFDVRVQNLVSVKSFPLDLVYSRDFEADTLRPYRLVMLLDNPVLADRHAETVRRYVEAGGSAYIEGACLNNPLIQALCGVAPGAGPVREVDCEGALSGRLSAVPAVNREAEPLTPAGDTAIYRRRVGRGTVVYSPLVLSGRIHQNESVERWMRELADALAGPPPVSFDADATRTLESTLFSDGRRHLLTLWNTGFEPRPVTIRAPGIQPAPRFAADLCAGTVAPFDGSLTTALGPGECGFVCFFSDPSEFPAPPSLRLTEPLDPGASATPGREVAAFAAPSTPAASTPAPLPRPSGVRRVGVFSDHGRESPDRRQHVTGDDAILAFVSGLKGIEAVRVHDLQPGTLAGLDLVILPNIGYGQLYLLRPGWERRLREYVEAGGGALLLHRTVGHRPCAEPPLPAIGLHAASRTVPLQDMVVTGRHPVLDASSFFARFPGDAANPAFQRQMDRMKLEPGSEFRAGAADYVPLRVGPRGEVLAISASRAGTGGDPVLIAGTAGRGRAVLCGLALGDCTDLTDGVPTRSERLLPGEEQILNNAVYWLTERPEAAP